MKHFLITVLLVLSLALSGCTDGKAKELFETAEFEELQNSYDHAEKLYQKILDKYPDSEYASKARSKLDSLKKRQNQTIQ